MAYSGHAAVRAPQTMGCTHKSAEISITCAIYGRASSADYGVMIASPWAPAARRRRPVRTHTELGTCFTHLHLKGGRDERLPPRPLQSRLQFVAERWMVSPEMKWRVLCACLLHKERGNQKVFFYENALQTDAS